MEQIDLYSFSGNFHISPLSNIYLDCVCGICQAVSAVALAPELECVSVSQ